MKTRFSPTVRHTLDGTVWNFLGETLALPMGFLVAIYLTRRLGPDGYGLYALIVGLVLWVEWSISGLFCRATIKLVGEADDWHQVGGGLMRLYLVSSCSAAALFCLLATPLATLMGEPAIAGGLRLLAIDIPLFALAQLHKNMLIGIGGYRQRALSSAGRWIFRLLLIVLLVELGFSITGAILGNIGATLVELAIGRHFIRPTLSSASGFPYRLFWHYAVPLFLSSISLSLFNKLDLFALKALGGTAADAGFYGAAQNLSLLPGIFALSFAPLLLSSLNRLLRNGKLAEAKRLSRNAMRATILLLPFAGMVAGAAAEIVRLLFGVRYAATAPLLSVLIVGAGAQALISIVTVIVVAMERPALTFILTVPLVPLAVIGHLVMIPRIGALGAALVTTCLSCGGALIMVLAVHRLWQVLPPLRSLARSLVIFAAAYGTALFWPANGFMLLVKLLLVGMTILAAFYLTGEFSLRDLAGIATDRPRKETGDETP